MGAPGDMPTGIGPGQALSRWDPARLAPGPEAGGGRARVVASLKTGAVLQRLSDAAEGLSQAADRLAELLALADD